MIRLRPYQEADEVRRQKQREATARWRARHPERNRASQLREDAKPERKAKQAARAHAKRATEDHKAYTREYRQRPEVRERAKAYEASAARREYQKNWKSSADARAKRALAIRERRKSDPIARLENRMRSGVRRCVTGKELPASWRTLVDFTTEQLREHLERQFMRGMSWDNAGEWHIDHIVPLSRFAIKEAGDNEFRAAWALTNLRPLWKTANLKKRAKLETML